MHAWHNTNNAKQYHLKKTQCSHWFLISALKVSILSNYILKEISLDDIVPIYKELGEYYTMEVQEKTERPFSQIQFFPHYLNETLLQLLQNTVIKKGFVCLFKKRSLEIFFSFLYDE